MKGMIKRLFCGLMASVVLMTSIDLPIGVNEVYATEVEETENTIIASGECGESITWSLIEDGILNISGSGKIDDNISGMPWASYSSEIKEIVVEEGITEIGEGAFRDCSNAVFVVLPNSLRIIGVGAFLGNNFEKITIPEGVEIIRGDAFIDCNELKEITIPNSVIEIDSGAFAECDNLEKVILPNNLNIISYGLFANCPQLSEIEIPANVTELYLNAFAGCSALEEIFIHENIEIINPGYCQCGSYEVATENLNYASQDGVLFNKNFSVLIGYPSLKTDENYEIPDSVEIICDYAFSNCYNLKKIEIPESVTTIGKSAFERCLCLETIKLPANVDVVSEQLFASCENLSEIQLGENITEIGRWAFSGCINLKTIELPDDLTIIDKYAFSICKNLEKIIIPKLVTEIRDYAFVNCVNISEFVFEGAKPIIDKYAFEGLGYENTSIVYYPNTWDGIPTEIYHVGDRFTWASYENGNCTIVGHNWNNDYTIDKEATCEEEGSQSIHCGRCDEKKEVVVIEKTGHTVVIDEAVEPTCEDSGLTEGEHCEVCGKVLVEQSIIDKTGHTEVIDKSVEPTCEDSGLTEGSHCSRCGEILVPQKTVASIGHQLTNYTLNGDGTKTAQCTSCLQNITVNDEVYSGIFGEGITWFIDSKNTMYVQGNGNMPSGDLPWESYKKIIEKIVLEDGITTISSYAFAECYGLNEIVIPDGVSSIENCAFQNCSSLKRIILPDSVKVIGSSVFDGCSSLTDIRLPEELDTIKLWTFRKCSSLEKIILPKYLTTIQGYAFVECTNLREIEIPKSVVSIGGYAFANCSNLKKIILPSDMDTIGSCAFYGCSSLQEIIIPEGVTTVGESAFHTCSSLASIILPRSINKLGYGAFSDCNGLKKMVIKNPNCVIQDYYDFTLPKNVIIIGEVGSTADNYAKKYDRVFKEYKRHTVQFVTGIDDVVASQSIDTMFEIIQPKQIEKEGYFLKGWYTSEQIQNETTKWDFANDVVEGDMTLYAGWEANKHTVIFKNGEDEELLETSFGEKLFVPTIEKEGYSLIGWYTSKTIKDETTKWEFDNDVVTGDMILYAYWEPIYKVQFFAKGVLIEEQEIINGCTVNIPKDNENLYVGWYTSNQTKDESTQWNFEEDTVDRNLVLYAKVKYKINYYVGNTLIESQYVVEDELTKQPDDREGLYEGWYTSNQIKDESTKWDFTVDTINRDINLYAKQIYKVVFYDEGKKIHEVQAIEGETIEEPKLEIELLSGWHTSDRIKDDSTLWDFSRSITRNLVLYSRHKEIYSVKFYDERIFVGQHDVVEGEKVEVLELPAKQGYFLEGWSVLGTLYNFDTAVWSDLKLYAVWSDILPVDIPKADIPSEESVEYGTSIELSTNIKDTKIYYTLDGSEPNRNSKRYAEPIVIKTDTVIKAFAVKDGYRDSKIATYEYTMLPYTEDHGDVLPADIPVDGIPEGLWIAGVEDRYYTGGKINFDLRVYDYKTLLIDKKDYSVTYKNNTKVNDASVVKSAPTITITGKGNYSGTITKTFKILPLDISQDVFSSENIVLNYNKKVQKPVPAVLFNGKKLNNKTDYSVEYISDKEDGYKEPGNYDIRVIGKGNFTGNRTITLSITEQTIISKASVSKIPSQKYTGQEIKPEIIVKIGKTTLGNEDYDLTYFNNVDVGTATITITGKGSYVGTKNVTFNITGNPMSKVKVTDFQSTFVYTGEPILQENVQLTYTTGSGKNANIDYLVLDEDYEITGYSKNTNVGTATVEYKGKAAYSGSLKKTFKITAYDIAKDEHGLIRVEYDKVVDYAKGGVTPEPRVYFANDKLEKGVDYTVSYKNNKSINDGSNEKKLPTIIITGKGNFKGNRQIDTFCIISKDIKDLSINISDVVYKNKKNSFKPSFSIKDLDGKVLKAGTDYDNKNIKYYYEENITLDNGERKLEGSLINENDILPVGTVIRAEISGKGSYFGTISGVYRIVAKDISKAKISVSTQYYTGKEIKPGKNQITITVDGVVLRSIDYKITGYSNNVNKGKGTISLKGVGNYGGTKNVTFNISNKAMSYILSFNGNGATSGTMKNIVLQTGRTYVMPKNTFVRKGFTFVGWNTEADGSGIAYSAQDVIEHNELGIGILKKLYAQWEMNEYNITYVLNGGENDKNNPNTYNTESETIVLANPKREYYVFNGWYTSSNYKTIENQIKTGSVGNKTYFAKWIPNSYTITYNLNGGVNSKNNPKNYSALSGNISLNSPSKTGYIFDGWYLEDDYTTKISSIKNASAGNIELYAKWSPYVYYIAFDANNSAIDQQMDRLTCQYDSSYRLPINEYEREGFIFKGWNTKADGTGTSYKNQATIKNLSSKNGSEITLYAIWDINSTSITSVTKKSYKHMLVEWTMIDGIDGYELYRSTSPNGTYKKVATLQKSTYIDTGLNANTTYYYKVRTYIINKAGKKTYSPYSLVINGKTGLKPSFSARLATGSGASGSFIGIEIVNKGGSTFTLGGTSQTNFCLYYPTANSDSVFGQMINDNNNSIIGVNISAGDYGYALFRLTKNSYYGITSMVGFYFVYDDCTYTAIVERDGDGMFDYVLE